MPAPNVHGTTRTLRYGTAALAEAAALIAAGEPVAVPTETVYGLAADATNPHAVARIYAAKGRPSFNPLIVHVPDVATAETIGVFDAAARPLAGRFWPGPARKSVVSGKSVSVRVGLGGRRSIKKKQQNKNND